MTAREAAGIIALAAGWLAVGEALLVGLGIVRTRRDGAAAAGLALVTGWAASGIVVVASLMAGARLDIGGVVIVWACLAAAGLAAARFVGPERARVTAQPGRSLLSYAAVIVVAGYLGALLVRALVPLGHLTPDAWTQWLLKAKVIYFLGGLDTGPGGFTHQVNADYPPLDPTQEATAFHFAGSADFLALPLLHWIVFTAFVGAIAFVLRPRVRADFLWPGIALLVLAPKVSFLVGSSLADEPLAILITLAGVTATVWLLDDRPHWLALACVFLVAAALTKNEGLLLGLVLAATFAAASRRPLGVVLLATPLVAYLPWKAWLRAHDVPSNFGYDFGRVFHPGTLVDDRAYLWYGLRSLLHHLFAPTEWLLIVPAALVLGLLLARGRRRVAVVGLAFPLVVLVGFSAVYWLGNGICTWMPGTTCNRSWHDIEWLVGNSADRIVASVALLLAALLPLFLEELEATPSRARARASEAAAPVPRPG